MRTRIAPNLFLAFVTLTLLAVAGLTGCKSFGLQEPQTFEERLAYAYATHTAALDATTTSLTAGDIKADDAEAVLKVADEARVVIDGARLAYAAGDIETAEGRLALATNLLQQLQAYLRAGRNP